MRVTKFYEAVSNDRSFKFYITIHRQVERDISYSDGWNIDLGPKTYNADSIRVTIDDGEIEDDRLELLNPDSMEKINGDSISYKIRQGAYGRIGKVLLRRERYDAIASVLAAAIAEAECDEEWRAVKALEEAKEASASRACIARQEFERERSSTDGWCNRCHSHCYGDCTANSR